MITGAHSIIYSTNAEADRDFLRDVLGLPHVDVGQGWLIFGLPPAEVAVHPHDQNDEHELYFIVDDVEQFIGAVKGHGIDAAPVQNQGWGLLTQITLPGGGKLGVYQPRHARPPQAGGATKPARKPARASSTATSRKGAAKTPKKAAAKPKKAATKTTKKGAAKPKKAAAKPKKAAAKPKKAAAKPVKKRATRSPKKKSARR